MINDELQYIQLQNRVKNYNGEIKLQLSWIEAERWADFLKEVENKSWVQK